MTIDLDAIEAVAAKPGPHWPLPQATLLELIAMVRKSIMFREWERDLCDKLAAAMHHDLMGHGFHKCSWCGGHEGVHTADRAASCDALIAYFEARGGWT